MNYFDGNTVTGLWNYAQNFAMSDNNWDTDFGPSTPGALNLISGQTGGSYAVNPNNNDAQGHHADRGIRSARSTPRASAPSTATSTRPTTTARTTATPSTAT